MLNPKHLRYATRIQELIEEGKSVALLEKPSSASPYIQGDDKIRVQAWLASVGNILETVFGSEGIHYKHFREVLPKNGVGDVERAYEIYPLIGVLSGALDDLEKGFLIGQEFIIAGEVFDTILEQAKYLNESGYKDPAAVLARVVLEDTLKRLARRENIDDSRKASAINDALKSNNVYPQLQWRFVQAWLDIGNAAAHGRFNEYDEDNVIRMIEGIEQFLVTRFL